MTKHLHDQTFHAAMSDPRVARDLFINQYPAEVIDKIDLDTLTICQETFVDEITEDELIVDVLYKAKFKQSDQVLYLYLLTEAQGQPEQLMPWRVTRYVVRIIEDHLKATNSKILPVVLPLIFYHGKSPYNYSTNLFDLFNDPVLAKTYMFNDISLIDLSKMTDETMLKTGYASLMMGVMRHAWLRDLVKISQAIMPYVKSGKYNKRYLQMMLKYAFRMAKIKDKREFSTMINVLEEPVRGESMTIEELLIQEGLEKGLEKGKAEGIQEGVQKGEQNLFIRLLKSKFPKVSAKYLALINRADEQKLFSWGEKILHANKLEEIFD